MTIQQGVNLETLEGFRTFLQDNLDKAKLKLEAKALYESRPEPGSYRPLCDRR